MFDENQLVEIMWSNKTRKHYESKGYIFSKYEDKFYVKAKDLPSGSGVAINVICDYCNKEYKMSFTNFNKRDDKSKDACNHCRALKQYENSRSKRAKYQFDKLRKFCSENDYILLTGESEFTNVNMNVSYICKKHGMQSGTLFGLANGRKCIHCSYEERGLNCRHSVEYIKSVIESYNGNEWLNQDEYIGSNEHNLKIKCGLCGNVYITSFSDYTTNMQIRCRSCAKSESNCETIIRKIFEDNNINFIQEKKFDGCKDSRCLPFDFYLPDYNLCIEYDGRQHYYPVFGEQEFLATIKHDNIKNEYCNNNHIDLLRIPYWDKQKIEEIINNKLNL